MTTSKNMNRRELIKLGAAAGAAGAVGSVLQACGGASSAVKAITGTGGCAKVTDINHVVIFIQENRSFDHYFGSYRGVRGFSDMSAAFNQPYPGYTSNSPSGVLLPFHLDTTKPDGACTHDINHDWIPQHQSWNNGAMNGFVSARASLDGPFAVNVMGYYTRADLPYYYALADAFTLCDNYFCSVMGPTDPNRLYSMAASIDPDGKNGGPLLQTLTTNRTALYGKLTYTTMPEQLQARNISWKVYSTPDQSILNGFASDNILPYFKNFQDPNSVLYKNAMLPQFPTDFAADVLSGSLPQVSWIIGSIADSDHPPSPSVLGESELSAILTALTANPSVWANTVLFVTYDENGGFFDHVAPMTAPPGTPGEYVTATPVPDPTVIGSPAISGPIGLGFRVPMLILSPFSRGGFVSSSLFDHTSILRFLETRFGAEVPNLSAWRRAAVGDLTSAFNFSKVDTSVPSLPSVNSASAAVLSQCAADPTQSTPYQVPNPQSMPTQESGSAPKPTGAC